jgi:hypothetical protein
VRRPDGSVEQVRVGTAVKSGEGFALRMGELQIGGVADAARPAAASYAPAPSYGGGSSYGGSSSYAPASAGGAPTTLPNYGRSKGAPIYGASMQDLEYYSNGCKRTLNDPSKERWHAKERQLLAALEAEIERQRSGGGAGGGSSGGPPDDVPPPGDEDIPF